MDNENEGHPAWAEALEGIPDAYAEQLTDYFKKWDEGVSQKFEKYKPLEQFAEFDPQQLQAGVDLYNSINSDPEAFYKRMAEYYNFNSNDSSKTDVAGTEDIYDVEDPRIKQLAEQQAKMQEFLDRQEQQHQQAEADNWLSAKRREAEEKYGNNIDWDMVLPMVNTYGQQIGDFDKAFDHGVQRFVEKYGNLSSNSSSNAQDILPPTGGVEKPNEMDYKGMSNQDIRKLGAAMLSKMAQGG